MKSLYSIVFPDLPGDVEMYATAGSGSAYCRPFLLTEADWR